MGRHLRTALWTLSVQVFMFSSSSVSVRCNRATVARCNNDTTAVTIVYADTFPALDLR